MLGVADWKSFMDYSAFIWHLWLQRQRVKVKQREAIETEVKCSQEEHSTQVDTEQQ